MGAKFCKILNTPYNEHYHHKDPSWGYKTYKALIGVKPICSKALNKFVLSVHHNVGFRFFPMLCV
jgi:CRISPR/Cas system endoribonuclease Cas6 (RAMP superfamily)